MKTYLFSLLLMGAVLAALPSARADDATTSGQAAPAGGTTTGGHGQRLERFRAALAQLNLSEAQKGQIKQIFTTVTDHKERRRQIVGVLTPDQKAKLKQMIQEHRNEMQAGGGTPATPSEN